MHQFEYMFYVYISYIYFTVLKSIFNNSSVNNDIKVAKNKYNLYKSKIISNNIIKL